MCWNAQLSKTGKVERVALCLQQRLIGAEEEETARQVADMLQPLLQAKQHAVTHKQHCEQERVGIVKHSVDSAKICKVAECSD